MPMLDTAYRVATPEGVELSLRLAGPTARALAWLIDLLWRAALLLAVTILAIRLGDFGTGVILLSWFALEWIVPAWCEAEWGGATPGKKALRLRVIHDDGSPVGWGPALTRNFLRFADFLPLLYLGGLLSMLGSRQFKRLGDYVAGTLVIHVERDEALRAAPTAEPIAPPYPLSAEEAQTLLDLAQRVQELGPSRSNELAALAVPWLPHGDRPLEQLVGYASYLRGTDRGVSHAPG